MNAISTFLNKLKTQRKASRYIRQVTDQIEFKDTDHGREVYELYDHHDQEKELGSLIFVGQGVRYDNQELFIVEGLQSAEGQMAIYIDNCEYFQGTRLGFEDEDVIVLAQKMLEQQGVFLGSYHTRPAEFY